MGEGLLVFTNFQDLGHKLVHYHAKDHSAHRIDSQITNGCNLIGPQTTILAISWILYDVRDDDGKVGDDMHNDRDFFGHQVVYRPSKSYHPADAPDQDHAGNS